MKKLIGIAFLATAALVLLAGDSLAGQSGDPPQTQLLERTREQTCDPAQDCDGNQIQRRPGQGWSDEDEAEVEFLLWLFGP